MIRRLEAILADDEKETGLTLVEVMVAAMLTVVVLVMVGGMFVQTARITSTAVQSRTSNGLAGSAMQEITNVVRLAAQLPVSGTNTLSSPVVSASTTKIVITAYVSVANPSSPVPTQVTIDSSTGSLVESRCGGTKVNGFWSFTTCSSSSTQTLGGPVVAPDSTQNPLFTYQDVNGATLAMSNGALPPASLPSVATVTVSVKVQSAGQTLLAPVYLTANVPMPNVGLQKAATS